MTNDPMDRLGDELTRAARTQAARRIRRRRTWLLAGAITAVAAPVAAQTTGILDLGHGTTNSGVRYSIQQEPGPTPEQICQTLRTRQGHQTTVGRGCSTLTSKATKREIVAGYEILSRNEVLVYGTVGPRTAKLTDNGTPVRAPLQRIGTGDRRAFHAVIKPERHISITAQDASGRQLATIHLTIPVSTGPTRSRTRQTP